TRLVSDWSSDVCSSDLEADVRLSLPVLLGSLATCGLSALLSGAAPAWRAARVDLNDALKSAAPSLSPGRDRLRRALVASECALRSEERRVGKECRSRWV